MKSCDYCGRENEDVSATCIACGTELHQPISDSSKPARCSTPRVLNAKFASIIFISVIAAIIPGSILAALLDLIVTGPTPASRDFFRVILPLSVVFCQICSGAALVLVTKALDLQTMDTSPTGAAWVRGSWRAIMGATFTGLIIFFINNLALIWVGSHHSNLGTDYLGRMRMIPGFARMVWIINAVLFAPFIEELLFRGVLYGGYRRSLGHGWSTMITTSIFVLMHFPNLTPIRIIETAGMGLAALWWRLRSRAIGPSIAAHFTFNALTVLQFLLWLYRH